MSLIDVKPDPKPARRKPREKSRVFRHVATLREWRELRAVKFDGQVCRICGSGTADASSHHLLPRSMGGDDVADCIVRLCGDGVRLCHGKVEAHDPVALATLALRLEESEYVYLIGKLGEGAMERLFHV